MAIINGLVRAYAQAVYMDGTKEFADIKQEYVEPVKAFAAIEYTKFDFDYSLRFNKITKEEYDEVLGIKYPDGIPEVIPNEMTIE